MQQQQSPYAKTVPSILAEMEQGREEDGREQQPDPQVKRYVYRTDDGGIFISPTKIGEDEPDAPVVDSEPEPTTGRPIPLFVHFLLMLLIFVTLDNSDTFFTMLAPTVTVTVTPVTKTLSTTATVTVGGAGADVHGRVLAPLTLSQTQTVSATGKGHQDAQRADGILTFFNGSFTVKTIDGVTVFTGSDNIQVVTDQTVTIPPGNPPTYGETTVTAHAAQAGSTGNIAPGDINTSVSSDVLVKNSAFSGGRDARDFTIVSKADIQGVVSQLTPRLLQSEQAALTAQLVQGESFASPVCTPRTTTNHNAGEETQNVTVTVSQTCATVAYNQQELQRSGERILATTHAASLVHFQRVGGIHIRILSQVLSNQRATLKAQLSSTWVYELNQQRITSEIVGKPRLEALHLLAIFPGVQRVSIAGVNDNQQLPTDASHIHLSLFYFVS